MSILRRASDSLLLLAVAGAGGFAVYRLRRAVSGFHRARLSSNCPTAPATGGMADAAGEGRRGAQPLGFPAGRAWPAAAASCRPANTAFRPRGLAPWKCSTASRAATSSTTNWSCPKARICSISPPRSSNSASSRPADFWHAAARPRARSAIWTRRRPTLEGYLFPDTYRLSRHTTPEHLCRMMTGKFREAWREPAHHRAACTTPSRWRRWWKRKGKLADERPLIAAVFENRLRIGMKLDCDPTTIYAALLDEQLPRHRSTAPTWTASTPTIPTAMPACRRDRSPTPGLASITRRAAPRRDRDALYFVLRPDDSGGHEFSPTSPAAHEAAMEQYRRGLRK